VAITGTIGAKYFIAIDAIWKNKVLIINFVCWSLGYINFRRRQTIILEKWITWLFSLGVMQIIMLVHENFATFLAIVFFHILWELSII
jgi:hypothetical protein